MTAPADRAIYTKTFGRNFTLGYFQIWYWGEATDQREWISRKLPYFPYIVFHRLDEAIDIFYDLRGIEWLKNEIIAETKKDRTFTGNIARKYKSELNKASDILDIGKALPIPEFKKFTEYIRKTYSLFEGLWWSIEALENLPEYKNEFDYLMKIRKDTEGHAPAEDLVIRNSITRAYPEYSKFTDVILLEEVFENRIPTKSELLLRQKEYYYTNNTLFTGSAKEKIEEKFHILFEGNQKTEMVKELKGQVAYKGKVSGKVRKMFSVDQISQFREGEILVAATTTPNFLPAIKKAAALIGDDGGIISHTAIVARELKKPCIIGTKIATKVLNDGDRVEVDADKGIVRIINHS